MWRRASLLLVSLVVGCAGPRGGEKGGLVPVRVTEAALEKAYAPRRFALLVGISHLSDPRWRDLRFADKDAQDFARVLREPKQGHFDEITVLTRPEETTRAAVLEAVAKLQARATRPDDVVVIYLSAHGTLARDNRGELRRYLVTGDATFDRVGQTALPVELLRAEFEKVGARRRMLVLATCHSGGGKSLLPEDVEKELEGIKAGFLPRPLEESSRASMIFSASDWGEAAREDERLANDIYTHFLIEGLQGPADRNLDGAVTATEAHDYARRRTHAFTGGRQHPSAEILEVGADPIILTGAIQRQGQPELYSYSARLDGFTLKVDGDEKAELPGGAAVRPGSRRVELTKGGEVLFRGDVELASGERLELESLMQRGTPRRAVTLLGGLIGFLDGRSRNELLPSTFVGGAAVRWDDAPAPHFSLWADVAANAGQQVLRLDTGVVPFTYRSVSAGLGAGYAWRLGGLSLIFGPRVAGLWLQRSFQLETYQGAQSYLTVTPGLFGALVWPFAEHWEVSMQGNVMLTYVVVDGSGQALGFGGGWAGLGYRF